MLFIGFSHWLFTKQNKRCDTMYYSIWTRRSNVQRVPIKYHQPCARVDLAIQGTMLAVPEKHENGALHDACQKGHLPIVKTILETSDLSAMTFRSLVEAASTARIHGHLAVAKYIAFVGFNHPHFRALELQRLYQQDRGVCSRKYQNARK